MEDEDPIDIRFAIVRFQSSDEPARFRMLLRQHGFEEPTWLDDHGQAIAAPHMVQASQATQAGHAVPASRPGRTSEERCTQTTSPSLSTSSRVRSRPPSPSTAAIVGGSFLRLPTVLVDPLGSRPPRAQGLVSAVLPLATASSSPSSSSMSVCHPTRTSPTEITSTTSRDTSDCPPDVPSTEGPSTSGGVSTSTGARAWVSPAPLRPRGKKPHPHEDPNVYYTCTLCNNKILGTRVSNLQNHVRRHSTLKQFQCCYCEYAHNEIAKVRLHMTNNHKDNESAPVNNLTSDMQAVWSSLFRECFPTRAQRRRGMRATQQSGASSTQSQSSSAATTSSSTAQSSCQNSAVLPLSKRRRRHRLPHPPPPPQFNSNNCQLQNSPAKNKIRSDDENGDDQCKNGDQGALIIDNENLTTDTTDNENGNIDDIESIKNNKRLPENIFILTIDQFRNNQNLFLAFTSGLLSRFLSQRRRKRHSFGRKDIAGRKLKQENIYSYQEGIKC